MYHAGGAIELTLTGVGNSTNTTTNCNGSNSGSGGKFMSLVLRFSPPRKWSKSGGGKDLRTMLGEQFDKKAILWRSKFSRGEAG